MKLIVAAAVVVVVVFRIITHTYTGIKVEK